MTKRVSLTLSLLFAAYGLASSGCSVNTCKGDECNFDDDDDPFFDGGIPDGSVLPDGGSEDSGLSEDMDGGPEGDGGPVEGLTLAEFCDSQLTTGRQWADALDTCCAGPVPQAGLDFLAQVLLYPTPTTMFPDDAHTRCVDLRQAAIDDGEVVYHADKAAACAASFANQYLLPPESCPAGGFDVAELEATIGHGAAALPQLAACRAAFEGQVERDGLCDNGEGVADDLRCGPGLRCLPAPGDTLTCQPSVDNGGACSRNSDCDDGLTCLGAVAAGDGVCRESDDLGINGADCRFSRECVDTLVCDEVNECATPVADVICD